MASTPQLALNRYPVIDLLELIFKLEVCPPNTFLIYKVSNTKIPALSPIINPSQSLLKDLEV